MIRITVAFALAGCAAHPSARFPAHTTAATITELDDDALMEGGYVNVGTVEAEAEKEHCQGTIEQPKGCQVAKGPMLESRALLMSKAGERGGDLVRVQRFEVPSTAPLTVTDCSVKFGKKRLPSVVARELAFSQAMGAACVDEEKVVGFRRLLVSSGSVWRRAPELVPNMRLVRAVEAEDEEEVAAVLPTVTARDTYLEESPLVLAAKKGNTAILQRLLAAGVKVDRDAALLVTVARADEAGTQALLAAGASPDAVDPTTREHPLHIATRRQASPPILKLLIDAGAKVNALNAADQPPLQCALISCDVRAARMLIEAGANRAPVGADQETIDTAREACPDATRDIVELLFK